MKYSLHVHQKQAVELGIKNINQAHVFDLLTGLSTWAKPMMLDGELFYWISRNSISTDLPLLHLKPDTVYRHLKDLEKIGLIEYRKDGRRDCVRLTNLGRQYYSDSYGQPEPPLDPTKQPETNSEINPSSQNSEINPSKLGNKSENNSEINPTDQSTNIYPSTKNSVQTPTFEQFYDSYNHKKKRPEAERAWSRLTDAEKHEAFKAIPDFNKSIPDYHDKPHPASYLNGKRWTDDLTPWTPPQQHAPMHASHGDAKEKAKQSAEEERRDRDREAAAKRARQDQEENQRRLELEQQAQHGQSTTGNQPKRLGDILSNVRKQQGD